MAEARAAVDSVGRGILDGGGSGGASGSGGGSSGQSNGGAGGAPVAAMSRRAFRKLKNERDADAAVGVLADHLEERGDLEVLHGGQGAVLKRMIDDRHLTL